MLPPFLERVRAHAGRQEQHVIEIVCVSILLSRGSCFGVVQLGRRNGSGTGNGHNKIVIKMMKVSEPQRPSREYYLGYVNTNDL